MSFLVGFKARSFKKTCGSFGCSDRVEANEKGRFRLCGTRVRVARATWIGTRLKHQTVGAVIQAIWPSDAVAPTHDVNLSENVRVPQGGERFETENDAFQVDEIGAAVFPSDVQGVGRDDHDSGDAGLHWLVLRVW